MNLYFIFCLIEFRERLSCTFPKNFAKVNKKLFKSQPVYRFFDPSPCYFPSTAEGPALAVIDRKRGGMGVSKFISLRVTGWAKRSL